MGRIVGFKVLLRLSLLGAMLSAIASGPSVAATITPGTGAYVTAGGLAVADYTFVDTPTAFSLLISGKSLATTGAWTTSDVFKGTNWQVSLGLTANVPTVLPDSLVETSNSQHIAPFGLGPVFVFNKTLSGTDTFTKGAKPAHGSAVDVFEGVMTTAGSPLGFNITSWSLNLTGVHTITPLPPALPFFVAGLGVMGWLASRKRRNAKL